MKKFLKQLFVFFILILTLAFAFDLFLTKTVKQSNDYFSEFEVWNDIYNGTAACDVAIYGSSRAYRHFNSSLIEDSLGLSTYNFGMNGHHIWLQYMRHLEILKHNPKPKVILYSVEVSIFEKRDELFNPNQFLPYMLWNTNMIKYTSPFEGYDLVDYFIPLIRYYGKKSIQNNFIHLVRKPQETNKLREKGFDSSDKAWNTDFEKAKKELGEFSIVVDTASVVLFEKFIEECKSMNIELILVNSPTYVDGQQLIVNRQSILDMFTQLADKHDLTFIDYSTSELCADKNLFYNSLHLNSSGADIFTTNLISDLTIDLN
jgi:hypothetical protein